jgi:pimeloyl-ACP methyl ester carboxylesterase
MDRQGQQHDQVDVQQRAEIRAAMHRLLASAARSPAAPAAAGEAHDPASAPAGQNAESDTAGVRSIFTALDATSIHHLEAGGGRPVVLLHGGSGGGANWFRMLPYLARKYRVLAPDLPGFGLSDRVSPTAPLGSAAAGVLASWLEAVDVTDAVVAGTSFGGLAALRLAQSAPARVSGLFLLSSAGLGRELPLLVRLATLPGLTATGVRPSRRGTATLFRRLLTTNRSELTPEQLHALIDYLYLSARRAGTPYLADTLRLFATYRGQREVLSPDELSGLAQQVSVVWGALDPFLAPSHAHFAARHCQGVELTIIPDAGHSPNWERPAAVLEALDRLIARV